MATEQQPLIRVLGFKTAYENLPVKGDPQKEKCDRKGYKLDASGSRVMALQEEVYVTYAPSHSPINTQTTERVRLLYPDPSRMGDDQDGEKLRYMSAVWSQIEPAYEAFKTGKDIPINGTPLGVWSGISPEQAEIFRNNGIRTVEEVRDLTDSQGERIRLPNIRDLRKQAGLFLENTDAAKAAEREAQKDAIIAEMADRLAKMEALIDESTAPKGKAKAA